MLKDGRFYFEKAPTGEYLLTATSTRRFEGGFRVYYPGTSDRSKAFPVRVTGKLENFAFPVAAFPYLPVRVLVENLESKTPIPAQIYTRSGDIFYAEPGVPYTLFALQGSQIRLVARTDNPDALSEPQWIQVKPGLKPVRLTLRVRL